MKKEAEGLIRPFLLAFLIAFVTGEEDAGFAIVETELGKIRGIKDVSTEGNEFYSFMGIPYAKPPVGPLRFKDPEEVEPWEDELEATRMPPFCPQVPFMKMLVQSKAEVVGSEDCLFINVFTAQPNNVKANLPVMVFIHGGGYFSGGANEYPPNVLLNEDIVFVAINYRLGAMGFLSTEDDIIPGNFGLKDQTLALSWVQKHIHHFGGDPNKVTIFGCSAGGASVNIHILSPASKGLFARAIMHSGNAFASWSMGAMHKEVTHIIAEEFNCTTDQGSEVILECLQKVPAKDLGSIHMLFMKFAFFPLVLGPRVDGKYLPRAPQGIIKENLESEVDIMTGVTKHDGGIITYVLYGNEFIRANLLQNFKEVGPYSLEFREGDVDPLNQTLHIYDHYIGELKVDESSADAFTKLFSDRYFMVSHDTLAHHHIKNSGPSRKTYIFEFDYKGEVRLGNSFPLTVGKHWICHMDDLVFLFYGGDIFPAISSEDDHRVSMMMRKMWTNFARTGNPTPDSSLGFIWEDATLDSFRHLSIDSTPEMADDKRAETREFWSSLPLFHNFVLNPEKVRNLREKESGGAEESSSRPNKEAIRSEL